MIGHSWKKVKGSEIVGLSLTELIMLITFALLLVMTIFYRETKAAQALTENYDSIERAAKQLSENARTVHNVYFGKSVAPEPASNIQGNLQNGSDALERLVEEAETDGGKKALKGRTLPEVWTVLVRAEADAEELAKLREKLAQLEVLQADREKRVNRLTTETDELRRKNKELGRSLDDIENAMRDAGVKQPRELARRLTDLTGQMANLQRRSKGIGDPPCWVSREGDIEYTYIVRVLDTGLRVEADWPVHRSGILKKIGAPEITGPTSMTQSEFRSRMRVLYEYGQNSDPKCRFFVKVLDETGASQKAAWRSGLKVVEGYFYKRFLN